MSELLSPLPLLEPLDVVLVPSVQYHPDWARQSGIPSGA